MGRALVSVIGHTCARELEPVLPAGGNRELNIKNADVTSQGLQWHYESLDVGT